MHTVRRIPFCGIAKARFLGNWRGVGPTHAWFATIVAEDVGLRGGVGGLHSELARVRHL